jgi:hypothetical protein
MTGRCEHGAGGSGHAGTGMLTWHAPLRPARDEQAGGVAAPQDASRDRQRAQRPVRAERGAGLAARPAAVHQLAGSR